MDRDEDLHGYVPDRSPVALLLIDVINDLDFPGNDDYFVLKPKHSGFFSTTLDTLLAYLGARTLILAGVAGNICVFFTANDAYMRDFGLVVPRDCVASNTREENDYALSQMAQILRADTTPSTALDLTALLREVAGAKSAPAVQEEGRQFANRT